MARSGGTTQASLQPQKSGAGRHTIDTINKKTVTNRGTIDTINRLSGVQVLAVPPDLPNSVTQGFSIEHHKILAQPDRHKSDQIGTIDTCQNEDATIGRTKAQNPRCSAQKKGWLQRHETLTDRSLQAFLPALSVRTWDEIRHRYNLKKAAQVGTRSTQIGSNRHDRHMPKRGSKVACCKEKARLSPIKPD